MDGWMDPYTYGYIPKRSFYSVQEYFVFYFRLLKGCLTIFFIWQLWHRVARIQLHLIHKPQLD